MDSSANPANDPLGRELDKVDAEALERLHTRLLGLERESFEVAERSYQRYEKRFEDLLSRMSAAKRGFDGSVDDLREKLVAGPVNEDELRARLVMLDMEYGSRLRLAEEGFRLLKTSFDEHLNEERLRSRNLADDARDALRERVQLGRGKILEVFENRDKLVRESRQELERLRKELDDMRRGAGIVEFAPSDSEARRGLEQALRERDEALAKTKESLKALQERAAELERAASEAGTLKDSVAKLEEALREARRQSSAEAAPLELEGLRERLKESVVAKAEALGAANKLRALLNEAEQRISEREAEIGTLSRANEDLLRRLEEARFTPMPNAPAQPPADAGRLRELEAQAEAAAKTAAAQKAEIAALRLEIAAAAPVTEALRARVAELEARPPASAARSEGPISGDSGMLKEEVASLRGKLRKAEEARDFSQAKAEEAEAALESLRGRLKELQKSLLSADVTRDRRFEEERAQWQLEKEALEEKGLQALRELNTLKSLHDATQRDWEETLTRQDAKRMQEIFKLRAQLQKQKWNEELGGKEP